MKAQLPVKELTCKFTSHSAKPLLGTRFTALLYSSLSCSNSNSGSNHRSRIERHDFDETKQQYVRNKQLGTHKEWIFRSNLDKPRSKDGDFDELEGVFDQIKVMGLGNNVGNEESSGFGEGKQQYAKNKQVGSQKKGIFRSDLERIRLKEGDFDEIGSGFDGTQNLNNLPNEESSGFGGREQQYAKKKQVGLGKRWCSRSNLERSWLQDGDFDKMGGGFRRIRNMGSAEDRDSGSGGGCFNKLLNGEGSDLEGYNDDDEGLRVLDSYDKNQQTEFSIRFEKSEDEFRHPLVREACRLIKLKAKWNPDLEGELRHLLRSLKPHQVCAVLHLQEDERVALEFFCWADRQWRYRHYPIVYYAMLQVLSKTKLFEGSRRVIRLMRRRGIQCSPEAFGYLMISYSRAEKLRHALSVLSLMQKAGVQPNLSICNTTIHVLVMGNRLDKALKFLERMQLVGIAPDVVTYNCLIKGYCGVHRVKDAMALVDDMPRRGCAPDKVSFYTVMAYFCKEKNMAEIKALLKKMMDHNCVPDMVTYNTLIHMLCKYGHSDEACEFLREAQEQGFRVDKVGYTALVHALCQERRIDKAKDIVNEMVEKGCIPDVVTYTTLVNGFCQVKNVDEAKKMLQQMYKDGCKPNTVSYTALLNGLCQIGRSSEARKMLNTSEEEWWTPNCITYSVVMHGFLREGKFSEACDVVRESIEKGFLPSPAEINLVLVSLCREGKTDEAKKFMEECLNKGCDINVVNFTTVIHGYCQMDDLEGALSLLDDMYLVNKRPDVVTYTAIADALSKNGKFEEATDVIKKMVGSGILPNPVTYRTIIHRYCQHGRVEELLKLFEKLLLKQPYNTAYNRIIEKLCCFGYVTEAYKLLGEVLRTASKTDAHTCHVLMKSYLHRGSPLLAYKVACRMFKRNITPDFELCKKVRKSLALNSNKDEADNLMMQFVERGLLKPFG